VSTDTTERARSVSPVSWPVGPILLSVALGALAGIGGYTFRYAEGLSYLSTDPKACVNCHIMRPQYDGWSKSSHHAVAVCVDCHLPQGFFAKYVTKTENGWRHGKLFTTQTFREPIEIQAAGSEILQENCVRCHESLVHAMAGAAAREESAVASPDHELRCVHCHWTVGHGERAGLGGPLRRHEVEALRETAASPSSKR
jgi:cytochrome c nitrite reductase small subunit